MSAKTLSLQVDITNLDEVEQQLDRILDKAQKVNQLTKVAPAPKQEIFLDKIGE